MRDLQQALEELSLIRSQLAQGTQFRGYGPGSIAVTGVLAIGVALSQSWWFQGRPIDPDAFLQTWVVTAVAAAALCCWKAVIRSRKMHAGFSGPMLQTAVEQFAPAVAAGLLLTVVLARAAPTERWMLPGLWEIAFSLGIFASRQFLPRPVFTVGVWYLVAGLSCLVLQAGPRDLAAWTVGIPFGIGQLLLAAVLQCGYQDSIEKCDTSRTAD
jgi:hypothetical protein